MRTDAPADEEFRSSVLALALVRRVVAITAGLVLLWLAVFWAEALP